MRATLIVNGNAGNTGGLDVTAMERALHDAGFDPVSHATSREEELEEALDGAEGGLVVAAGGDGTVRAVAGRLLDRPVPLAVLPLGTANNIGRALGLAGGPLDLVAGLARPERRTLDVGRVQAPWGETFFLEGFGCGLYADALAAYDPEEGKSVGRALGTLATMLGTLAPQELRATLDGRDVGGASLLFEVLNTSAVGPRLRLAPGADPFDGFLDVVRVDGETRDGTLDYVRALLAGDFDALPSVRSERGRRVELAWVGQALHVDGEIWPRREGEPPIVTEGALVSVEVCAGALEVWLPGPPSAAGPAGEPTDEDAAERAAQEAMP